MYVYILKQKNNPGTQRVEAFEIEDCVLTFVSVKENGNNVHWAVMQPFLL